MLYIYCDGGLGNRINCLINGLYLADVTKSEYQICWPLNRYCEGRYADIFEASEDVNGLTKKSFEGWDQASLIAEDNFLGLGQDRHVNPRAHFREFSALSDIRQLLAKGEQTIVFYPRPFGWAYTKVIGELARVRFSSEIKRRYQLLKRELQPSRAYYGLHLRGTDGRKPASYYQKWRRFCRYTGLQFVLVSDDSAVMESFRDLPNVWMRQAVELPAKANEHSSWDAISVDENGERFPYNVSRSAGSILDAAVDLLLLADTRIVVTSQSTFLETAINLGVKRNWAQMRWFQLVALARDGLWKYRIANEGKSAHYSW